MPSNHLILCLPLLLLPPIPPSIRVFPNESTLRMRWPMYWSFSFSITPSKEIPGADLLQNGLVGAPCSPRDSQESSPTPQFKSINSSVLTFLHNQLSHPYMTTGKTIPLTRRMFVGKVMWLHFNMLSQFSSVQSLSRVQLFATPESQHARSPCPSPTPRVHQDSRPSSQ